MMRPIRLAGLGLAAALAAGPARAQMDSREGIALQNQILELRRDMQQLRQQGGVVAAPPAGGAAPAPGELTGELLNRVIALEDSVRQLRGRIEEQQNAQQRQMDELGKRIGDLEFRAGAGGGSPPPAAAPAAPASPGVLTAPPGVTPQPAGPVRRTPEIALQDGNAALARRDFVGAEASAREVLAAGKGPRATDAEYLLAQSLAGKRDYQGAAVAYDDAYARNPKGSRAPDSLLGLANALSAINEKRAACQTMDKLRAEFPTLRPDLRPIAAAARQRAGCG